MMPYEYAPPPSYAPPATQQPRAAGSSGAGWIIAIVVVAVVIFSVGGCWSTGTTKDSAPIRLDSVTIAQPAVQTLEEHDGGVHPAPHSGTMPQTWRK